MRESSSYAFFATQSSAADGGVEGDAEGEGETDEDGLGETDEDGLGETEEDGDGDTQATTMLLEQTLTGSMARIGAGIADSIATGVCSTLGLGDGRVATGAGLRTKYTIATVKTIAKNIPSDISSVFFVVLLIAQLLAI